MDEADPKRPKRPSPEDFLRLIERQRRGKLKVYLGSAAGVGKTYAMLVEGRRLKDLGVDVVIGYVEPHDRPETTAQIGDLERVPPLQVSYQGATLREMDLDAVLRRKPTVVLVDELAHTNVPGCRHAKRYEDVLTLLDEGIHVITTLNVQHFESLYNIVEEATGVRVRERVPDALVAEADQIVNVDLPAEDLIDRLKAGKVYPPEQAQRALEHFFTERNLTHLRELALSEAANFLDRRRRREELPEAGASVGSGTVTPGPLARVVVALSSGGPNPEALIRKAARLAQQLNGTWQAAYVRTPRESPQKISGEMERRIADTLEIAQRMGGTVVVLKGEDVAEALTAYARESGASHLVMGKPGPRPLRALLRKSLVERLAPGLPGVDFILG